MQKETKESIKNFISVLSVGMSVIATYFLAKGALSISPEFLAKLASPKFDYNSDIIKSLAQQRADITVGFVLMVVSLLMQNIRLILKINRQLAVTILILSLLLIISIGCNSYSKKTASQIESATIDILEKEKTE